MAYTAKTFVDGEVLKAEHLNQMQQGIEGAYFTTDSTLSLDSGVLKVKTVNKANDDSADNTLPITAAAVNVAIGNIDVLLKLI